jgi:Motility quorum-sensing regulator, toxin of MqsA
MNAAPVAPGGLGKDPRAGSSAESGFHHKGTPGAVSTRYGLDEQDACDVLANLMAEEFDKRLRARKTGEWMYVFEPEVGEILVYLKVILRSDCIVIPFHEEKDQGDENS